MLYFTYAIVCCLQGKDERVSAMAGKGKY